MRCVRWSASHLFRNRFQFTQSGCVITTSVYGHNLWESVLSLFPALPRTKARVRQSVFVSFLIVMDLEAFGFAGRGIRPTPLKMELKSNL